MFKVNIIESERGWGRKVDRVKEFPTEKQAKDFIKEYNKDNTSESAPDWYMQAELVPGGTEDAGGKLLVEVFAEIKNNWKHLSRNGVNIVKGLREKFPELKNYE